MKFTTRPESTVYLLGYDNRLFQGNEINKDDVVKELTNYDGNNKITVFHIKKRNWHECDSKELKRVALGRRHTVDHGGDEFTANPDDDEDEDSRKIVGERKEDKKTKASVDEVQGVWLFDKFEVPDGELTKIFTIPNSSTTWMISSFSMNEDHGLAIGQPKELIIKN